MRRTADRIIRTDIGKGNNVKPGLHTRWYFLEDVALGNAERD